VGRPGAAAQSQGRVGRPAAGTNPPAAGCPGMSRNAATEPKPAPKPDPTQPRPPPVEEPKPPQPNEDRPLRDPVPPDSDRPRMTA